MGNNDVTWRGNYVTISKQKPYWILRLGFLDFIKTSNRKTTKIYQNVIKPYRTAPKCSRNTKVTEKIDFDFCSLKSGKFAYFRKNCL